MPHNLRNTRRLLRNRLHNTIIVLKHNILPIDINQTDINLPYKPPYFDIFFLLLVGELLATIHLTGKWYRNLAEFVLGEQFTDLIMCDVDGWCLSKLAELVLEFGEEGGEFCEKCGCGFWGFHTVFEL